MDDVLVSVTLIDNSEAVKAACANQIAAALEAVGFQAERYAKTNLTQSKAVDTGRLRNSVTHAVRDGAVYIGTNVEYAAYVEMGTGDLGTGTGKTWVYRDERGKFHRTSGMKARPYLKPAVADHTPTYKDIVKRYLKDEGGLSGGDIKRGKSFVKKFLGGS